MKKALLLSLLVLVTIGGCTHEVVAQTITANTPSPFEIGQPSDAVLERYIERKVTLNVEGVRLIYWLYTLKEPDVTRIYDPYYIAELRVKSEAAGRDLLTMHLTWAEALDYMFTNEVEQWIPNPNLAPTVIIAMERYKAMCSVTIYNGFLYMNMATRFIEDGTPTPIPAEIGTVAFSLE
jgi:hypothetical protein